ncbi:MAG: segregation/condensation protein A [Chloroflexi bacterium]|nr:segregation/condensation protein A [Chloroflexota bacterium]
MAPTDPAALQTRPAPARPPAPTVGPRLIRGATSIGVTDDPRPDRAAHVQTGDFDGPLALLLSLIEHRQLDVLSVPLGELAASYLEALAAIEGDQLPHISSFITVASQLILIKSRARLPRDPDPVTAVDEGPDPEEALRLRLIEYRRYRDVASQLGGLLASGRRMFHREPTVASAAARTGAVAPPPRPMDPAWLPRALERWIQVALPLDEPPVMVPRTVTVMDRARVIREALRAAPTLVLQDLLAGITDRVVVAVTFLAMLELVKGRELTVEQAEPWGPISIRRREGLAAADAPAADDGDADDD